MIPWIINKSSKKSTPCTEKLHPLHPIHPHPDMGAWGVSHHNIHPILVDEYGVYIVVGYTPCTHIRVWMYGV